MNNKNEDRLDVQFRDVKFIEILKRWKFYCKSYDGGITARLNVLISDDIKKLKSEVLKKYE